MERTATALLDGPDDAEEDAFLDEAGFAGAADRAPRAAATEDPEDEDDTPEEKAFDPAAEPEDPDDAEDEEADPAEAEQDDAEDEDEPSPSEVAELRRQVQELTRRDQQRDEAATRAVQELHAERQRTQTAGLLIEMRARMTDQEWDAFTGQLAGGYKDHQLQSLQQRVQQFEQAAADAQYQAAETEAFSAIMDKVREEIGRLSSVEVRLLESSQHAAEFKTNLKTITDERRGRTEPARSALREQRRASEADRAGVKSSGGARPAAKSYDNFNPDQFDAYLDDVAAPR